MKRLLIYLWLAALFLLASAAGAEPAPSKAEAPKKKTTSSSQALADSIVWHRYDQGMKLAKKKKKKVFINVTAQWCPYCRKMEATTFRDPGVISRLNKYYIPIRIDGDSSDSLNLDGVITTDKAVANEYRLTGYPSYWFLTSEGERLTSIDGYRPADFLISALDFIKGDLYKKGSFADFLAAKAKGNDSLKTNSK